jgi:hypothetical protein
MPSTGLYKSFVRADGPITEAGLLKAWWTPVDDFTTLSEPVLSDPQVIGEKYNITTDHVWQTGKEAIKLLIDPDRLEAPGKTSGDVQSLRMVRTPKAYILGDGPIFQEMVDNMTNTPGILIVQKNCDVDAQYLQYGCDCYPTFITAVSENQGTVGAGGTVGYEIEFRTTCKFFYNGAISERT